MAGFIPLKPTLDVLVESCDWMEEEMYEYNVSSMGPKCEMVDLDVIGGMIGLGIRVR
jgi:hypothetical protein